MSRTYFGTDGADWTRTFAQDLTDKPGKLSWPITSTTFILMYKAPEKPASASAVLKFFDWAYVNGDAMAADLAYVPLPTSVKALVRTLWSGQVRDASGQAVAYK